MFWFFIPAAISLISATIRLIDWLFSVWDELPKEIKSKIIETIVSVFVEWFKKYYQDWKKGQQNKND